MRLLRLFLLTAVFGTAACSSSDPAATSPAPDPTPGPDDASAPSGDSGISDGGAKPDAPAAAVASSKGTGGLTCASQADLGGGRKACTVKVGSVELKVMLPSKTGPLRLGLYLHGDGAGAHKSNSALKAMIAWSDAQAGLGVSALAPNGCSWWQTPTWDCASSTNEPDLAAANAAALAAAFDAILKAYDVRLDGVRYYGSSGGSIFLTDEWIPLHGGTYPGVHAVMCGGDASSRTYGWDKNDATLRAKHKLFFTYGDQDYLKPDIEKAIAAFQGAKFDVTTKVVAGAQHCAFDGHAEAMAIWTANP